MKYCKSCKYCDNLSKSKLLMKEAKGVHNFPKDLYVCTDFINKYIRFHNKDWNSPFLEGGDDFPILINKSRIDPYQEACENYASKGWW